MSPLSRRQFLASTAVLASATASPFVIAADEKPQLGLGFSLYGLPKTPLADALRLCAQTGYDSVELVMMAGSATEPQALDAGGRRELRESLARQKLVVAALMENLPVQSDEAKHREQLDRIKAAGQLAHDLSADSPPPLETIVGGKPGQWDELKSLLVDRLGQWAEVAEQARLVVCVKPHAGGALNTPEHARWLVEQINSRWLRLVYDFSHYEHRGYSLADTMRELVPLCPFVHVKDRAADTSRLQFLLPGEGQIDYTRYARLLAAAGYRGQVVVEVSAQIHGRPDYDPRRAVTRCYETLSRAFAAAGVRAT